MPNCLFQTVIARPDKEDIEYRAISIDNLPINQFQLMKSALSDEFMKKVNKDLPKMSGKQQNIFIVFII